MTTSLMTLIHKFNLVHPAFGIAQQFCRGRTATRSKYGG